MVKKIGILLVLCFLIGCGATGDPVESDGEPALQPADGLIEQSAPLVKETEAVEDRGTAVPTLAPAVEDGESTPSLEEAETIVVTPPAKETPVSSPENGENDMKTAAEVRQALSNELGLAVDAVEVLQESEVTWRDGSLGCPQPGMNYIQALTPGRQLILQAGGDTYHYHAGSGGAYRYCPNPQPPLDTPEGGLSPNQTPPEGVDD